MQHGDISQRGVLGLATHLVLEHRRDGIFPGIGRGVHANLAFAAVLGVLVSVDVVGEALGAGDLADADGVAQIGIASQSTSRNILEV